MAAFLLTFPATAPADFLDQVEAKLRHTYSKRLQAKVFLFQYDMELADEILGRAAELGVTWTLHMIGGDLVPMDGRMRENPLRPTP